MNKRKEFINDTRNVLIFCVLLAIVLAFAKWAWSYEPNRTETIHLPSGTITCTSAAGSTSCF